MAAVYIKKKDGTWERKIAKGGARPVLAGLPRQPDSLWDAAKAKAKEWPYEVDLTGVTSLASAFRDGASLVEAPFLNTGAVTDFNGALYGCAALVKAPAWDYGKATNMASMFRGDTSLTEVPPLSTTSALTNTSYMFTGCTNLRDVSVFDTSGVTNAQGMFSSSGVVDIPPFNFSSLTSLTASNSPWSTSVETLFRVNLAGVPSLANMFSGRPALRTVNLITSPKLTNLSSAFSGSKALTSVVLYDTSSVTDFNRVFSGCSSLMSAPDFQTGSGTTFSYMFDGCSSMMMGGSSLDLRNATATDGMFNGCTAMYSTANPLNMPKVTSANYMFNNCSSMYYAPNIAAGSLTTTSYMFNGCTNIRQVDVFDTSKVTTAASMFKGCTNLSSIPPFDFSGVTAAAGFSGTFDGGNLMQILARGMRFNFSVANNKLDANALNTLFYNMGQASGAVVNISNNPGAAGCDRSIANSKGWTVTG